MQKHNELNDLSEFKNFNTDNWSELKNHLFLRLFNKDNLPNKISLDEIPHSKHMDLVLTYSVEEKTYINGQKGINAYMLKNKDIENFPVDVEMLKKIAILNIKDQNSARIETLVENALKANVFHPLTRIPEGTPYGIDIMQPPKRKPFFGEQTPSIPMFAGKDSDGVLVVSNRTGTFATTNILFSDTLNKIYDKFDNENFYIIPMSVHKAFCIKQSYANRNGDYTEKETIEELSDMLEYVNDVMNVNSSEILSYSLYYYLGEDRCTMIIN